MAISALAVGTGQGNRSADDGAVTVEVAPPEAVAEYHHRLAVGNRGLRQERWCAPMPPRRPGSGNISRRPTPRDLRRSITVAHGYGGWETAEHPGEDLIVVAQIFKHRPQLRSLPI